jgi:hypothetical protein
MERSPSVKGQLQTKMYTWVIQYYRNWVEIWIVGLRANSTENSFGARYNSKNHLGARYLSLELLPANLKNHLELGITSKIMKKLRI